MDLLTRGDFRIARLRGVYRSLRGSARATGDFLISSFPYTFWDELFGPKSLDLKRPIPTHHIEQLKSFRVS